MREKVILVSILFLSCLMVQSQYYASGRVYLDKNSDGDMDGTDVPQTSVRVHVFRDIDGNGSINGSDSLVSTAVTDGEGNYLVQIPVGKVIQERVSNDNDDAEEDNSDGSMYRTSSDLELIEDGSTAQTVGVRFRNVPIANAETINNSYITFTVDEEDTEATSLTIRCQDADNGGQFSNSANDISSRTTTTSSVAWNTIESWSGEGTIRKTPDLTSIIDSVINRAGFSAGNAIVFIFTGSGERTADSHDGNSATAPLLTIDYGSGTTTYIAVVDTNDLSTGHTLTSSRTVALSFSAEGDTLSNNFGYSGESVGCFAVADGGNILYQFNRYSGIDSVVSGVSVSNIEAMTYGIDRLTILAADADELGEVNKLTGGFTARSSTFGTGGGAAGDITFSDVDAIAMDATQDTMFGVYQTRLFVINSSTGAHVPDYFGSGVDYITITGSGGNLDDIAIDPTTGTMYGTNASNLYTINTSTGAATLVGAMGESDMEGMTFSENGDLYGTTGTGATNSNSKYSINKSTGSATLISAFSGVGTDYESCECLAGSSLAGILPITLGEFTATSLGKQILLEWTTLTEINNNYFDIQRSNDGKTFSSLDQIEGQAFSKTLKNYSFLDETAKDGINFYRLMQVDLDGSSSSSPIIHARAIGSYADGVKPYPNPASDYIQLGAPVSFRLYDAQMRAILEGVSDEIDVRDYQTGVYFLQVDVQQMHKILIAK